MKRVFKKDLQYYRFSLYGFLKNQKFYEPFFLLFLLSKDITYFQAGLLYSIREIAINLLEIPAGIVADSAGRRRTMLISFLFYILSFALFFLAKNYLALIAAIIVFAFGDVFRTGTHKAMIYDYLKMMGWSQDRVLYYGHTRSWSQIGSAVSSLLAAAIVIVTNSYNLVFAFAIIPYLLNMLNLATYPSWMDGEQKRFDRGMFLSSFKSVTATLITTFKSRRIIRIYSNSTIISGFYNSVKDYLQPLILALVLAYPFLPGRSETDRSSIIIGIVYFIIYLLTSRASILSGAFARVTGSESKGMNYTFLAVSLSGILSGLLFIFGFESLSIILFVFVFVFENLRRPICVAKIAAETESTSLSTFLSVDSQLKSLFTMIISPVVGLIADYLNPGAGILIVSCFLLLILPLVFVREHSKENG